MDLDEVELFLHLDIFRIVLTLIKDAPEPLESIFSMSLFDDPADILKTSRDSNRRVANRIILTIRYSF